LKLGAGVENPVIAVEPPGKFPELIGFFSYSRERAAFERDSEKLRVCAKRGGRQRLKRAKSVGGGVLCQCWHR
jgi:hypothetical protein